MRSRIAGLVNMAMVMMASSAFHAGHPEVAEIETAYHTLTPLLGAGAAGVFLLSLIASGISASTVGTMAGQLIMQGFVGFRIPVWVRRLVTMLPAFVVVAMGVNATNALVHQPGGAQHRAAAADDRAHHLHRPARHHGRLCQRQGHAGCRAGRRRRRADAQYGADRTGHRPADTPASRLRGEAERQSRRIGYRRRPPQSGFQIKLFS